MTEPMNDTKNCLKYGKTIIKNKNKLKSIKKIFVADCSYMLYGYMLRKTARLSIFNHFDTFVVFSLKKRW